MKRKQLESYLEDVDQFSDPKIELEQYPTDPHLAASVLYTVHSAFGDLLDKFVLDLGAGCGMLSIGSVLMGAARVVAVELDSDAVKDFLSNLSEFDIDNVDVIQGDVTGIPIRSDFKFDTVIMNPPFGTKNNEGIDMMFLETALNAITSDGAVYSFHKTSTRDFVVKKFQDRRYHVTVLAEMKFKIPQMYRQHRKKEVFVDVDFIRIIAQKSSDCGG